MRKPTLNMWLVIVSLIVIAVPLVMAFSKMVVTHEALFLLPEGGAQWIKPKRPVNLSARTGAEVITYRRHFRLQNAIPDPVLTVRALTTAQVYIDGLLISPFNESDDGEIPRFIELGGLTPGTHELRIAVLNGNGPLLLLAYCKALGIFTGPYWEASVDGVNWLPVSFAYEKISPDMSVRFPSTFEAFRALVPVYLPLFVVIFFLALFSGSHQKKSPWMGKVAWGPSQVRWVLLAAWAVLAVNNITKIPMVVGFDIESHYAYISYIIEKGTIPLATEGWQMFQSPLYYLVSAGLQAFLSPFLSGSAVPIMLRIIPLVCGALQVQLAYQAVRHVFPARRDLQTMGTIVGGLLPMNLYISQAVGNEPLAGVLSATAIVLALGILMQEVPLPKKKLILLGIVLGLACLTKVTAVLLIPAIVFVLIYVMSRKEESVQNIIGGLMIFLGAVIMVSGWYYLRNWVALGKPFIGGWDVSRGDVWWQEPGYRTIQNFVTFGRSLSYPVFSSIYGFWDSIYSTFWLDGLNSSIIAYEFRPPWNYNFMLSGALLSLLPAMGIILGFIISIRKPGLAQPGQIFSAYCIAVYLVALLYLYITVPIYSTAKATYTVGLIPCYAVMCATGFDFLTRNRYMRAAVYAILFCWAVSAYSSYFVV